MTPADEQWAQQLPVPADTLVREFDGPAVAALVLLGSHARGRAGPFSDLDLVQFVESADAMRPTASHLLAGCLVVVSTIEPAQVESALTRPEVAVETIAGLRTGRALLDRTGVFAAVQARARAFVWDAALQQRANVWAGAQMVGLIEEMHKGLEGLRRDDPGRLLQALHGGTWGLTRVLAVQRGVLLSSDNGWYDEVAAAVGARGEWTRLRAEAFGITTAQQPPPGLRRRVAAGLRLYVVTAGLLEGILPAPDRPLIAETVELINRHLPLFPE